MPLPGSTPAVVPLLDCDAWRQLAIADYELGWGAKGWDATVRLDLRTVAYEVRFVAGSVDAIQACEPGEPLAPGSVRISGSPEGWAKLLSPVPPPFYQDVIAAVVREDFRFKGDPILFHQRYVVSISGSRR